MGSILKERVTKREGRKSLEKITYTLSEKNQEINLKRPGKSRTDSFE